VLAVALVARGQEGRGAEAGKPEPFPLIFPGIMGVTAAAFALLGGMRASVVCERSESASVRVCWKKVLRP